MTDEPITATRTPAPAAKPKGALFDSGQYVVTDMRDELIWMVDETQLAALVNGSRIPLSERKLRRAVPGETVTGLPATSVKWLLADGWIVKPGEPWQVRATREGGAV